MVLIKVTLIAILKSLYMGEQSKSLITSQIKVSIDHTDHQAKKYLKYFKKYLNINTQK